VNPEVLIIGCGFLGEATAELFSAQGKRVLGLVRSPESLGNLGGGSFDVSCCDVTDSSSVESLTPILRSVPLAIYAVSSGRGGAEVYEAVYRDGLRRVLDCWQPGRMIFVGSTSVYGQTDGSWVDETTPAIPCRETGRILLEAESTALDSGGVVARLSGIYGPGRSVLLKKMISGEAVLEDGGTRWVNQVHRDDAAAALCRLGDASVTPGIYNVTDDTPATQSEVCGWIAEGFGCAMPTEGPKDLNRKRGWTSKRVSNRKIRGTGWVPQFASYRDALPQFISKKSV
jgi:nucleoside-diphosphate-sugar epimerase